MPGLRERKKSQTRQAIADTARRLFLEHGFEAVTVAQVAREAEVAEKTVFNYFPTKEDLFYGRLEEFEEELLDAVRGRESGTAIIAAFRDFVTRQRGALQLQDEEEATKRIRDINRVITDSPSLLARERQVFDRYAESLAELIAKETGARDAAIEPRV